VNVNLQQERDETMKTGILKELFDVKGKTALVSGAAGGIGACAAEVFCALGADVLLVDINRQVLEAQTAKMKGLAGQARPFVCAERAYWRNGGIINRLRMEYWRRRYNALTIGEAVQPDDGKENKENLNWRREQ
jgi:phosphoglycerate dehydrogenase-like enzyme